MIDLRSDTVTRPCVGMRRTMAEAEVGDDVYGEDPTVSRLEAMAAERLGHEAALFVSSGTQANLLAILSHCGRGDEYIAGATAHAYQFEGGGAAVLGGVQPQPVAFDERGALPMDAVRAAIKPDNFHYAMTRLVCIENTQNGMPLSTDYIRDMAGLCHEHELALHMDGARLFNTAVALSTPVDTLASPCHTVSICLSKGLGAPVGSLLVGPAELIGRARRTRKMLGGGMRQAGVIAAAGIFALENNVERLADDHTHAEAVAQALERKVRGNVVQNTNMIFIDSDPAELGALIAHMNGNGVRVTRERWVLHKDVNADDVRQVVRTLEAF